jgi:hypothetical protein
MLTFSDRLHVSPIIQYSIAMLLLTTCVGIQGCSKESESKSAVEAQSADLSKNAEEIAKKEAWLQKHSWEIVSATVPLMKGATFTFAPDSLMISGAGINVKRTFKISGHTTNSGREILDVTVDGDSLIIMKSVDNVEGTESFTMSWGHDGTGSLGLGRRLQ